MVSEQQSLSLDPGDPVDRLDTLAPLASSKELRDAPTKVVFVVLGGVIQEPIVSYTLDRDQITFASPPLTSSQFYILSLGDVFHTGGLKSIPVTNRSGTILTIPLTATTMPVFTRSTGSVAVAINPA